MTASSQDRARTRAPAWDGTSAVGGDAAATAAVRLHALFDDYNTWYEDQHPEHAMAKGVYRHADRITDNSLKAIDARYEYVQSKLTALADIDRAALDAADQLNYDLFDRDLRQQLDGRHFRQFLTPVGGRFGPQQDVPQMDERVHFNNYADYANYLTRLEQVPTMTGNTIELLKTGVREGRTPPRVCMAGVAEQFAQLQQPDGLASLATPFDKLPASITPEQRDELRARFDRKSLPAVKAALADLGKYVTDEYLPHCRDSIAAVDWPDGPALYAYQLRVMTTTDMTAQQIHELGLSEVARIRAEMLSVIRRSDFMRKFPESAGWDDAKLFQEFVRYLRTDSRFYYTSEDHLLRGYRDVCKRIDAELPRIFRKMPRLSYGVRKIPDFMAPAQTTAYYQPGNLKNAEAGTFYANTFRLDQRPKYEMVPLALHEAVPGHHFQIALAQEEDDLPEFRKDAWYTAFGEGWALYSERLGIEMGLFTDPYDDFGRLTYEMWRACRLVVDPGMHALGWSRDKAVQFMRDNTALTETNLNAEIDRYIAWPGQATAYKIGELKIRELRKRAEEALGPAFNVREFHDVVLSAGTIPLTILEKRVEEWIAQVNARKATQ